MRRGWIATMLLFSLMACGNKEAGPSPSKSGEAPASTGGPASSGSPSPSPAGKASGPLASLSGVGRTLNEGMAAFLGGKDATAAFPGWDAKVKDAEKLRDELKAAGATSAVSVFMEFELIFEKAGKDVYYLRTGVLTSDSLAAFMQFDGRVPEGGKVEVSSQPLDAYTGPGAPFKEAGDALLKMLQGPDCAKVPVATAQEIAGIIASGPVHDELMKGAEGAKRNVDGICKSIASLGADKVRLRIDDQNFFAKNAGGAVVGSIRGDFEAKPGKIEYSFGRFKAIK